jgi:cell division protein FtsA
MREQNQTHFIGIDIGTSAVRCIIGVFEDDSTPTVIGYGSSVNNGMRKGVVSHPDDVFQAVSTAVSEAERVSGVRVESATINIAGSHVEGTDSRGVVAISSSGKTITLEDRLRVEEAATIIQMPANRSIIQVFAKNYSLDGQSNIKDPVGMQGVRLEVDTHIVTASTQSLKLLDDVVERATIIPNHHTVSSLAVAEAVLTRKQKESGTVVVDIGAGTTSIVVFEDGEVQHVAEIAIGGIHITNDLAIGLKTDLDVAEVAKTQFGSLKDDAKRSRDVFIKESGKNHSFDISDIHMIISARLEELFELVDAELEKIHKAKRLPGGVVITGGSAKIPGIAEFSKEVLQLPARIGALQHISGLKEAVDDGSFTTAIGLMMLDMLLGQAEHHQNDANNGMLIRIGSKITTLFKKQ